VSARRRTAARPARSRRTARRGEFDLIRALAARLPQGSGVLLGPGDDAALLAPRPGRELVATTDAFVTGVHIPESTPPRAIGRRLAAANLSDLAAMAAEPRWALLSLGLSEQRDDAWVLELERGLGEALAEHGAAVVGGNVSRTKGSDWMSVTLLGDVERGRAWTRYGARPGDRIAITGHPGRAGAAIRTGALGFDGSLATTFRALRASFLEPSSRIALAGALSAAGAVVAAIDLSDGVSSDLAHLCEASGIGAVIEDASWPDDPVLAEAARLLLFQESAGGGWQRASARRAAFRPAPRALARTLRALRLGASDDYELLLAVDPDTVESARAVAAAHSVPLTFIGTCTDAPGMLLLDGADGRTSAIEPAGWDHRGRQR
jgi:thiamine-monophosphate kinase